MLSRQESVKRVLNSLCIIRHSVAFGAVIFDINRSALSTNRQCACKNIAHCATNSPATVRFPPDTAVMLAWTEASPVTSIWYSPAVLML